ncbi:hypothetical protein LCGC14_1733430 [marine sediment metagenome]|uniref:DUF5658 domain-containing protein n=1 Tax=marine sediment metagenome TaxID=412755 RepID=A0A0F9JP99_9ZZZZ
MLKLFLASNVFDSTSTWAALMLGSVEGNPIVGYLMSLVGVVPALAVKMLLVVLVGVILWRLGLVRFLKVPTYALFVIAILNSLQVVLMVSL